VHGEEVFRLIKALAIFEHHVNNGGQLRVAVNFSFINR
jgi:hypothetical protein